MAITSIVWPSSKERGTIVLLVELMRKLLVFEAPLSFLKTLNLATCQKSSFPENLQVDVQILGANMSALGLSQKPIYVNSECLSPSLYMYVSV
jgi:hypothetical protein